MMAHPRHARAVSLSSSSSSSSALLRLFAAVSAVLVLLETATGFSPSSLLSLTTTTTTRHLSSGFDLGASSSRSRNYFLLQSEPTTVRVVPIQRQRRWISTTTLDASTIGDSASSSSDIKEDEENEAVKETATAMAVDGEAHSSASSTSSLETSKPVTIVRQYRLKRLKDYIWVRETLEDLTAAEFACSVEAQQMDDDDSSSSNNNNTESAKSRRKRAVDYEKLLLQLNKRVREMGCSFAPQDSQFTCVLQSGVGSGSVVYSDSQRQRLLERLIRTRRMLMEVIRGYKVELNKEQQEQAHKDMEDGMPFHIVLPELPELRVEIPKETDGIDPSSAGPKLYVRDDGTVDWDGALQDQAALRKFGTAVWARINGREPETIADGAKVGEQAATVTPTSSDNKDNKQGQEQGGKPAVMARIVETDEIKKARARLMELKTELSQMEADHTAKLNSVMRAGQAVANVNLAVLNPEQRSMILESAESLEKMKEKVSYSAMLYELERVYTYLAGEFGNPAMKGYISLQDRLNVAEFGLLESQVDSFSNQLELDESIDADVLAVVTEQLNDFKRRLGIDYYVTGVTFDREAIQRWIVELYENTKTGLAFYVKGCRLFWNDVVFCLSLINRAAQGYTLKPREVRTIR